MQNKPAFISLFAIALCAFIGVANASIDTTTATGMSANPREYTEDSFLYSSRWEAGSGAFAIRKAKKNYMLHCATCHGATGEGNGELAELLGDGVKPRNHTDAKIMSQRTDEDLRKVISGGGDSMGFDAAMPPFSTILQEKEILGLVKYLRVLCKCKGKDS
ncbi:MAG: cytochrome c [Nitrospinota bacterium]|nr:cytochrome c [Nitrospinota bacterium]